MGDGAWDWKCFPGIKNGTSGGGEIARRSEGLSLLGNVRARLGAFDARVGMLEANARDLKLVFDPANIGFLSYLMVWCGAILPLLHRH